MTRLVFALVAIAALLGGCAETLPPSPEPKLPPEGVSYVHESQTHRSVLHLHPEGGREMGVYVSVEDLETGRVVARASSATLHVAPEGEAATDVHRLEEATPGSGIYATHGEVFPHAGAWTAELSVVTEAGQTLKAGFAFILPG